MRNKLLLYSILVVCLGFTVLWINQVVKWSPYPNQIDYGEGYLMYINNLWADGNWKWDLTTPPFIPLMYGVVFPVVSFPFVKIFGGTLQAGRYVEVMALIVTCVFMCLIARRTTGKWIYGYIAGLLPFTQPIIRDWSLQYRVDMLAVMFSVIGVWAFLALQNTKYVYLTTIPFLLAVMTKVSTIGGIGAVCLYLLIRDYRRCFSYGAVFIVLVALSFGILQLITGNQYVNHTIFSNVTTQIFWWPMTILKNNITLFQSLVIILSIAVWYTIIKFKRHEYGLASLFLITAGVVDLLTALRPGGYINYYIEFIIAACLCFSITLPKLLNRLSKLTHSVMFVPVLWVITSLPVMATPALAYPRTDYNLDVAVVKDIISDTEKPVITENPTLVVEAGKELYIEFFIMTNWSKLGKWDDTDYVNKYRTQYFDYVILRVPLWQRWGGDGHFTPEVMEAIRDNYKMVYRSHEPYSWYGLYVYESNRKLATDDREIVNRIVVK